MEQSTEALQGKRLVFVVGDSFVAGHGIKDVSDRFGDRLGEGLGDPFRVVTLAQNGWNSEDEFDAIRATSRRHRIPEIVVLSYFLNDIDVFKKHWGVDGAKRFLFSHSFLFACCFYLPFSFCVLRKSVSNFLSRRRHCPATH